MFSKVLRHIPTQPLQQVWANCIKILNTCSENLKTCISMKIYISVIFSLQKMLSGCS
jgi:hypothetical protein